MDFHNIAVLSDGRIIIFRRGILEVWHGRQKLEIPVPHYFRNQWQITQDETYIWGSFSGQVVRKWSLNTGQEVQVYRNDIIRPESLPSSTLITDDNFRSTAGCYLWRTQAGIFAHVGDGPRGWVTPITLSTDGKFAILPGRDNAALMELSDAQKLVSHLPFEGKMRAACILENRILIVNSAGKLFINDRSSHWPYNLLDRIKTYYRALRSS